MRHHYVPRFLLKAWADTTPDHQIEAYRVDMEGVPSTRWAPKATGYENNLYALTRAAIAGMDKQAVEEKVLAPIDSRAAHVRHRLISGELRALDLQERADWALFLISLRLRQPDIVRTMRELGAEHLRAGLAESQDEYIEEAAADDPETFDAWVEQVIPGLIDNFGLGSFTELLGDRRIVNKILTLKWWVWDVSAAKHELLLSDEPCIFVNGLDAPEFMLALPIGPNHVFIATRGKRVVAKLSRTNSTSLVPLLNEASVAQATTRVYARDQVQRRFIENRISRIKGC